MKIPHSIEGALTWIKVCSSAWPSFLVTVCCHSGEWNGQRGRLGVQPLVSKLSQFIDLSESDVAALAELISIKRYVRAHLDIASEGDAPHDPFVLLEGVACRYRLMEDGRRQILALILPGDLCELHSNLIKSIDHSIGTLAPTCIATIPREKLTRTLAEHPLIDAALTWSDVQDAAIQRELLVALGRRSARERIAYFLCEVVWRQTANGTNKDIATRMPITQTVIADMLGLTPVHVNRVLQDFRREGLIALSHSRLVLLEPPRLARIAELNESYLHLTGASAEFKRSLAGLGAPRGNGRRH